MPTRKQRGQGFEDIVSMGEVGDYFHDLLVESDELPIKVTTFENFVQDVFALSYPEYDFNTWHIHYISNCVDKVLAKADNPYLLAALPRGHLKSTILGDAFCIYRMLTAYGDGIYISYKEELAGYHLSKIKKAVIQNHILSPIFKDLSPQSDSIINYRVGSKRMKIFGSGIFAVKRGIHTDLALICDDILGDIDNPLVLTEIDKATRIFNMEIIPLLNQMCPLFLFGTVLDETDIFFTTKDNENFNVIWLPAVDPTPEHKYLWEARFGEKVLRDLKKTMGWKAFSTEYLLVPLRATEAFFTREQLDPLISADLKNFQVPGY